MIEFIFYGLILPGTLLYVGWIMIYKIFPALCVMEAEEYEAKLKAMENQTVVNVHVVVSNNP